MTYSFYFFVGHLPKFFNLLESITKSYPVEFNIHRKMAFYSLQKIVPDKSATVNDTCVQKIKIGHQAKFRDKDNFFRRFYSRSRDFTLYFHFRCVACATFDRNLIHSDDACFLIMVCLGYVRAAKNSFEPP